MNVRLLVSFFNHEFYLASHASTLKVFLYSLVRCLLVLSEDYRKLDFLKGYKLSQQSFLVLLSL